MSERYEVGHVEEETVPWLGETLTWMVVDLFEMGGTRVWVSSVGDLCPLGGGPEVPPESRYPAERIARVLGRPR